MAGWPGGQDINQEIKLRLDLKQQCLHKICISLKQKICISFISQYVCMYDGYGPNRILTKCLIHNRLFVLYIFSILKLNTCSIGHGWGKIVTIDTLAVCCPEKDRFVQGDYDGRGQQTGSLMFTPIMSGRVGISARES